MLRLDCAHHFDTHTHTQTHTYTWCRHNQTTLIWIIYCQYRIKLGGEEPETM